jgi:CDP-paratose 2-epimerase
VKVLITGVCGYVGSRLAVRFIESLSNIEIYGVDNLSRRGAETNIKPLQQLGVKFIHGDIRMASDVQALPSADWVIDCAANPSVIAGLPTIGNCTPKQLIEHNLIGTIHILEYCRERKAGLILLSTNRVYSIQELLRIPLRETPTRFEPIFPSPVQIPGFSERGISEEFPTTTPVSLYGATKLASEILALEYGEAFGFPVWVNRCGVIAGPGQFGKADQGIFSYWIYSFALGRPLCYIGWGGTGKQVRDCVTAEDVAELVIRQMSDPNRDVSRITNVGGGIKGAMSLRELTDFCVSHFGKEVRIDRVEENRPYDIPYYVTDFTKAQQAWGWQPSHTAEEIVEQLCEWTMNNMDFVRGLIG